MSSDTTRDNASVVDSSLTEWKNEENLEGPVKYIASPSTRTKHVMSAMIMFLLESPNNRANEEACQMGAEERRHSVGKFHASTENRKSKPHNTRYFIIKSLNHQNLQLSINKGIWATQVMNEPILEEAFHSSGKVILIFSVNTSGFFQGYAQMMSSIGWRRDNVWSEGTGESNPWGRSFKVKWLQLHDLPFQETLHLKNPLNHYKPVKISRDCQELPEDIGEALCDLLDGKDDMDASVKRGEISRDLPSRRPYVKASSCLPVQDFAPPVHLAPTFYSPFYQHQADASRFHLGHWRPTGASLGSITMDKDASARFDAWGLSAERSPLASTLTDDDILEMSYEEYLEVHSRLNKKLYECAAGPSSNIQISSSTSKATSDELELGCSSKKRPRHRSPRVYAFSKKRL